MSDLPAAIPAATLILMREQRQGPPQLLMIERAETMAFAAGALVFPGGRIDPEDYALAEQHPHADGAARIAAIRETIEEAGIAAALRPETDPAVVGDIRAGLAEGRPFAEVLAAYNHDFYQVDPLLFSPAMVTLVNLDTGNSFRYGRINEEILARSFEIKVS